jgi:hypothetical protein
MIELLKVKEKFGMPDQRLACAPTGCIGADNQAFLAGFEAPTQSVCACQSDGHIESTGPVITEDKLEDLVQKVTDQIMAGLR